MHITNKDSSKDLDRSLYLSYKKGERLFIISKEQEENWFAEHHDTGKQGLVKAADMEMSPERKNSGPVTLTSLESVQAEQVLNQVQARTRRGKLGDFFGASGTEIEQVMIETSKSISLSVYAFGLSYWRFCGLLTSLDSNTSY
jgi:hypothetical protein